jgi:hypothetical protein
VRPTFFRQRNAKLPLPARYLLAGVTSVVLTVLISTLIYRPTSNPSAPLFGSQEAARGGTIAEVISTALPPTASQVQGSASAGLETSQPPAITIPAPVLTPPLDEARRSTEVVPRSSAVSSPALTPTINAAAVPTESSIPADTSVAAEVLTQLAQAEADLRSGEFKATILPSKGKPSLVTVRFDLGGPNRVPVMELTTTYAADNGQVDVTKIQIGQRAWLRQLNGRWRVGSSPETVRDQLQVFLPHAEMAAEPAYITDTTTLQIEWQDVGGDSNVVADVAPDTGVPSKLQRENLATGELVIVSYDRWNSPVDVLPPRNTD